MTFTMLPIGRSVLRSRLHRILPVAALARAAPFARIPEGPGMDESGLVVADRATTPCAAARASAALGFMTLAPTGTAAEPVIARAATAIRSGRITSRNGGVGTVNYFRPGPAQSAAARRGRAKISSPPGLPVRLGPRRSQPLPSQQSRTAHERKLSRLPRAGSR